MLANSVIMIEQKKRELNWEERAEVELSCNSHHLNPQYRQQLQAFFYVISK